MCEVSDGDMITYLPYDQPSNNEEDNEKPEPPADITLKEAIKGLAKKIGTVKRENRIDLRRKFAWRD